MNLTNVKLYKNKYFGNAFTTLAIYVNDIICCCSFLKVVIAHYSYFIVDIFCAVCSISLKGRPKCLSIFQSVKSMKISKKIAIIGGRDFKNKKLLDEHMQVFKEKFDISHIVSGGA